MKPACQGLLVCLLALFGSAHGISLLEEVSQMPECAISCLLSAVTTSQCQLTNSTCVCSDDELQKAAENCITLSCTVREALATKSLLLSGCNVPPRINQRGYVIMTIALGALIGVSVTQRLGYKIFKRQKLAADDWLIFVAALFFATPSLIMNVQGLINHGMGRDIWDVPFDDVTEFGVFFLVIGVLYFFQSALIKLSLLVFYLRVFSSTTIRRLLWGTIVFTCLYGIAFTVACIFQCTPIRYFATKWDGEQQGHCVDLSALTWAHAGVGIVLDLWMLALPLSQLKTLCVTLREKIEVTTMFCVGTLFTIVSVIRLHVIIKFKNSSNPTWDFLQVGKWSSIEICIGIICVCLPAWRLLIGCILGRPTDFPRPNIRQDTEHSGPENTYTYDDEASDERKAEDPWSYSQWIRRSASIRSVSIDNS